MLWKMLSLLSQGKYNEIDGDFIYYKGNYKGPTKVKNQNSHVIVLFYVLATLKRSTWDLFTESKGKLRVERIDR